MKAETFRGTVILCIKNKNRGGKQERFERVFYGKHSFPPVRNPIRHLSCSFETTKSRIRFIRHSAHDHSTCIRNCTASGVGSIEGFTSMCHLCSEMFFWLLSALESEIDVLFVGE